MNRVRRWLAARPMLACLILIVVVAAPAFVRVEQINAQQDQLVDCLADWADQTTTRTTTLNAASALRADALDTVLRDVFDQITTGRNDPATFRRRLAEYVAASDAYRQGLKDNPVPDPPRIRC